MHRAKEPGRIETILVARRAHSSFDPAGAALEEQFNNNPIHRGIIKVLIIGFQQLSCVQ